MGKTDLWDRYNEYLCDCTDIGLALDISRINFSDGFLGDRESAMQRAFADMAALEGEPLPTRMKTAWWGTTG